MTLIESVPAHPSASPLLDSARTLFAEYGRFLKATQSCGVFNFERFEEEIRTLPAGYTGHSGELLLALADGGAAACIAYRASAEQGTSVCEIKRLFVRPECRGLGLARQLVAEVLERATHRGFTRAILDTDLAHMPAAFALYTGFAFHEYAPRQGSIAFLDRPLP